MKNRMYRVDAAQRPERSCLAARAWCAYFRRNANSPRHIPWHKGAEVTADEAEAIGDSVQRFQLGESGEGRHFLHVAEEFAIRSGEADDRDYVSALRLFIAEEQRHAAELGQFLDLAGIPRIQKEWSDGIFRWLRHLSGLELVISVLITAELIAKVYYAALRKATNSTVLRRLCEQILSDEVMHVRFQSERLARIRKHHSRWRVAMVQHLHRLFYRGTCCIVWWTHRTALQAGGLSFGLFLRKAQAEFEAALRIMQPWSAENSHTQMSEPESVGRSVLNLMQAATINSNSRHFTLDTDA